MSQTAEKIAGTYIGDDQRAKPPVLAWLQQSLREGTLSGIVKQFTDAQPEIMNPRLVLVDSVAADKILCRLPYPICDHENPTPSRGEVLFSVDPVKSEATRLA